MPTPRRLINKKAYDEMILIQDFLKLNNRDYKVVLELDENDKEMFVIYNNEAFYDDANTETFYIAKAYNYGDLMKNLTKHMSETR